MGVERTLGRVEADLRDGDVTMARTRLRDLVRSLPRELAARDKLAEVCRLQGDRAEAGRWSYLSDVRDPTEVDAFERACGRDPVRIMGALRWEGSDDAATEVAGQRLREVRQRAEARAGRTLTWTDTGYEVQDWRQDLGLLGCLLAGLVLLALAVVGAVTVVGWVV
ncbi:hypothetical protein J1G42_03820 [Cellulomonas sp. zg-ZUI222]|uniref:Uncharacterized protein n=1 Tax=Cellulomonas wangleii TaxID=2816956 RepID=A0ABX8D3A9_9CELL|nr:MULTISPECIES: DUF6584 family protein [Cellulomonas]MBO0899098.1 hypothetical protein [Cellulomonas sp. zg-ZUI22]MBO0919951.1 hypothetical protein [Cellulomonas wangleii]MBO0923620.1 hypothetical protein [Cellulomonas wangleii]QVI61943.1 hypothetical protein KG103_16175 [Cellulomonas wangleii]